MNNAYKSKMPATLYRRYADDRFLHFLGGVVRGLEAYSLESLCHPIPLSQYYYLRSPILIEGVHKLDNLIYFRAIVRV